jgi:hypothetical protein
LASQGNHLRRRSHLRLQIKETTLGVETHLRQVEESFLGVLTISLPDELATFEIETHTRQVMQAIHKIEALVLQVEVASFGVAMIVPEVVRGTLGIERLVRPVLAVTVRIQRLMRLGLLVLRFRVALERQVVVDTADFEALLMPMELTRS